jgi:hypothetical protein
MWRRKYFLSVAVALGLTVLSGVAASFLNAEAAAFLLLPGIFSAALLFSGGPHSDWPTMFFVLAATLNVFILSWPILGLWVLIENFFRRKLGAGTA